MSDSDMNQPLVADLDQQLHGLDQLSVLCIISKSNRRMFIKL